MGCVLAAPLLMDDAHQLDPRIVGAAVAAHSTALPHLPAELLLQSISVKHGFIIKKNLQCCNVT